MPSDDIETGDTVTVPPAPPRRRSPGAPASWVFVCLLAGLLLAAMTAALPSAGFADETYQGDAASDEAPKTETSNNTESGAEDSKSAEKSEGTAENPSACRPT